MPQLEDQDTDSPGAEARLKWLGLLFLLPGVAYFYSDAPILPSLVLFLNLWVLTLYDWVSFRLPNLLTATLIVTGFLYALLLPRNHLSDHLIGAAVGLLFFPTLNLFYKRLRGRDGIGLGDAKLLAGIGAWLGWQMLPPVLLLSSIAGLIYAGIGVVIRGRHIAANELPFGPFLCLGMWLAWLYLWPVRTEIPLFSAISALAGG